MSQATFRTLFIGRLARVGLLVLLVTWALAVVGPTAAQENTSPSAPAAAEWPTAPVGTPLCGPTQNVGGAIATDTTWPAGKVYVLTGDISVNQLTTLTIQPGAVIKINWDRGFTVNGKLVANGTAEHPIYFTSIKDDSICGDTNGDATASVPNVGDWRWIDFTETSDPQSAIDRAIVRYSGRDPRPTPLSTLWRAPIRFYRVVPRLGHLTLEKNYRNAVAIVGGAWLTTALESTTVVHILEGDLHIPQANTFTIPTGLKIKASSDEGITVEGKLIAQGSREAPIILTSERDDSVCGVGAADEPICDTNNDTTASVPASGDWRWIDFNAVSDPTSVMSYAIIRYGGQDIRGAPQSPVWHAPIRLFNAVPTLEYISFEKNYRNGAAVVGGSWLTNGLKSTTVVHVLEGSTHVPQANTFIIPAGVKIKPERDIGVAVDGKLLIQGTPQQPVVFTSMNDDSVCGVGAASEPVCDTGNNGLASVPATGDWRWMDFTPVSDPTSAINGTIFRYGGQDIRGAPQDPLWRAVLRINAASPTISNTAFVHNYTGIDIWGGAAPTLICLDFELNQSPYAILNEAAAVEAINSWWGSVSGPTHATNPHGTGNKVTDGVDFTPWRTAPCILPPTAPDAAFVATPTSGEAPLSVSFFNTSGGAVTSSQWAFGDGGTSATLNPTHVYTQPGVYSVTLTVSGPAGSDTVTNTSYIQVGATTYRMFAPVIVRPR